MNRQENKRQQIDFSELLLEHERLLSEKDPSTEEDSTLKLAKETLTADLLVSGYVAQRLEETDPLYPHEFNPQVNLKEILTFALHPQIRKTIINKILQTEVRKGSNAALFTAEALIALDPTFREFVDQGLENAKDQELLVSFAAFTEAIASHPDLNQEYLTSFTNELLGGLAGLSPETQSFVYKQMAITFSQLSQREIKVGSFETFNWETMGPLLTDKDIQLQTLDIFYSAPEEVKEQLLRKYPQILDTFGIRTLNRFDLNRETDLLKMVDTDSTELSRMAVSRIARVQHRFILRSLSAYPDVEDKADRIKMQREHVNQLNKIFMEHIAAASDRKELSDLIDLRLFTQLMRQLKTIESTDYLQEDFFKEMSKIHGLLFEVNYTPEGEIAEFYDGVDRNRIFTLLNKFSDHPEYHTRPIRYPYIVIELFSQLNPQVLLMEVEEHGYLWVKLISVPSKQYGKAYSLELVRIVWEQLYDKNKRAMLRDLEGIENPQLLAQIEKLAD